jgi:hypothetical protein
MQTVNVELCLEGTKDHVRRGNNKQTIGRSTTKNPEVQLIIFNGHAMIPSEQAVTHTEHLWIYHIESGHVDNNQ